MIEFNDLKSNYISVLQWGLAMHVGYDESKRGNEIIHKFCENLIDTGNFTEADKESMKRELEFVKEALSKEIKSFYGM